MTDEFGFEMGSASEVYEGNLNEMLDRLELQEAGPFESSFSEWEAAPVRSAAAGQTASVRSASLSAQVQKHKQAYDRLMRAIEAMKKHISVRNGRLHFSLPARSSTEAAARLGIDHRLFSHLYSALRIRSRHFPSTPQMPPGRGATISHEIQMETGSSCAGVSKVESVWWGVRLWLDECQTQQLIKALPIGSAALTPICAALGGAELAPVCAVFGGLGAAAGPLIDWADKSGGSQGVVLSWTWAQILPGTGVLPIVVSQTSA